MSEPSASQPDWADETEQRLLDAALNHIDTLGWTRRAAEAAGRDLGLSAAETELLLPRAGADLAALLARRHDAGALRRLAGVDPLSLKIRERIRAAVEARLDAAMVDEGVLRRWAGFLALPRNLPLALRLLWDSADGLWRWAGDVATDENHYSKRAILAGILATTTAIRLTSGRAAALAHLDARIENVMAYEKWKAGLKPSDQLRDIAQALARMRYGRRAEG
jgi:ubiquinone biosynthesis protein COQ9